jgi:hypothetical protein
MRETFSVLALLPVSACLLQDSGRSVELHTSTTRVPCVPFENSLCQAATNVATGARVDVPSIEGYQPTWGTEQIIRYQEFDVANPPADGSSVRNVLTSTTLLSQLPNGRPITLKFPTSLTEWFAAGSDNLHVNLLGERLVCATPAICAALLDTFVPATATFEITNDRSAPLRATAIMTSAQ